MKLSWKKLFGSKTEKAGGNIKPSAADNASHRNTLDRLREMEDLLQKKQQHLESRIEEQLSQARKLGKKNKRAALMALKRKRRLEEELRRMDGTLTTIELQRESLEAARNNVQVLSAMQDASNVLKNAQKYITPDKVLDIMDEVNEQQDLAREVADALANPLATINFDIDEAELERELEELEQEDLDKALLDVAGARISTAPQETNDDEPTPGSSNQGSSAQGRSNVPKPAEPVDPDEKELQELAQWST